jgi:thiamine biosynthesis lipoprotein
LWWIEATLPKAINASALTNRISSHLNRFEARYSRFRADSLIGRLNNARALEHPDPELIELLSFGQSLYQRTNGIFNILVGDVLARRGYGERAITGLGGVTTDDTSLPNPLTDLIITPQHITLSAGSVDIGGFGKGYVIDELATLLADAGVEHFLINGGGDLYGTSDNGSPISIYLEHPTEPTTYLGTTTLDHEGFAASSPYKRVWTHHHETHNHFVGSHARASFVKTSRTALADAFATAVAIMDEAAVAHTANQEKFWYACYDPASQSLSHNGLVIPMPAHGTS